MHTHTLAHTRVHTKQNFLKEPWGCSLVTERAQGPESPPSHRTAFGGGAWRVHSVFSILVS